VKLKTITTLVEDIHNVLKGNGGWDKTVTEFFTTGISELMTDKFTSEQKPRGYLSLSQVGDPCLLKLWRRIHTPNAATSLSGESLGNFLYGDILELLLVSLSIAAGHRVEVLQEEVDVFGVKGRGDVVIDGMLVDIKSASRFGFDKFRDNNLRIKDPFGYISQLSSYLYAYKDDPRVVQKDKAAFLAINKDRFEIILSVHDLREELKAKENEIRHRSEVVHGDVPPEKMPDVPHNKSGNMKLAECCTYCEFRPKCRPEARPVKYSTSTVWLTKVVKEPKVKTKT
jgi:hypothetical protein